MLCILGRMTKLSVCVKHENRQHLRRFDVCFYPMPPDKSGGYAQETPMAFAMKARRVTFVVIDFT